MPSRFTRRTLAPPSTYPKATTMIAQACRKSEGTLTTWCGTKNDRIMNSPIAAVMNRGTSRFTLRLLARAIHEPPAENARCRPAARRGYGSHRRRVGNTSRSEPFPQRGGRCADRIRRRRAHESSGLLGGHPLGEPVHVQGLEHAAHDDDDDDHHLDEIRALQAADELGL